MDKVQRIPHIHLKKEKKIWIETYTKYNIEGYGLDIQYTDSEYVFDIVFIN